MKNSRNIRSLEPILLFSVIFLPGYLTQALMEADPGMFNSGILLFFYIITAVPQIFLVLYLILQDPLIPRRVYGLVPIRRRSLLLTLPGLAGVFLCLIPVYILNVIILVINNFQELGGVEWTYSNFSILPLVLLSCLSTGYLEEIFFRSYLTTKLSFSSLGRFRIIILVNLLFASGHLYQGLPALAATFVIGTYLTHLFFVHRDIHLIAVTHALYNFSILLLSSFLPA